MVIKIQNWTFGMLKTCLLASAGLLCGTMAANALAMDEQQQQVKKPVITVTLPLVKGWFDGKPVLYIQTEASDPAVAKAQGVNYVARLANAINSQPSSVDDIYVVTNFSQGNVIPSAPIPTGPDNQNPDYSPLWQVSTVTWRDPQQAHTLMSEKDVLDAHAAGMVDIVKTDIVVNCPVVYSPEGGLLSHAKVSGLKIKKN